MGVSGEKEKKEIDWAMLLPDEPGKERVMAWCSGCHPLSRIVLQYKDKDAWVGTVRTTIGQYEALVPEEDVEPIAEYLARFAGENNPITEVPMDVNSVSAEGLKRLRFVSSPQIELILQRRSEEKFRSLEEVRKLLKLTEDQFELFETYLQVR